MKSTAPATPRSAQVSIVWLRRELRLADNPALQEAAGRGAVIPLYVLDADGTGHDRLGGAQRWWLHHSLAALDGALRARGSRLVLRRGKVEQVILDLVAETGADRVLWNRGYDRCSMAEDAGLAAALEARGLAAATFNASLLVEPDRLMSGEGRPYAVFTAFWRALRSLPAPALPRPAPARLLAPPAWPAGESLAEWNLLPRPDWAAGLRATWSPGEADAQRRLNRFAEHRLSAYAAARNQPHVEGTSMLSPHLAFGEIGPRQVWHAIATAGLRELRHETGAETYLRELGWREFAHHLLHHHAELPRRALRPAFDSFPWRDDAASLTAWQRGRTGFPIVDAGMRQLWQTGWMHNRVRMIVASFLVKDLLLPWQAGAAWFADTLVDADPASNTVNWQWVAGCGADSAPYFRIFNPVLQGRKFDPDGAYVRRFVPELARLSADAIHEPWRERPAILAKAGIMLGRDYPAPLVDHGEARARALAAWRALPRRAA